MRRIPDDEVDETLFSSTIWFCILGRYHDDLVGCRRRRPPAAAAASAALLDGSSFVRRMMG